MLYRTAHTNFCKSSLKNFLPLLALVVSACQTTQNTQTSYILSQHVEAPVYTGSISPITKPIDIRFRAFGHGEMTKTTKTKTVSSNGSDISGEKATTELITISLETRNHHQGVLWRISVPIEKTTDVIEVDLIKSSVGKLIKTTVSSSSDTLSNKNLAQFEKLLSTAFNQKYNRHLKTGDNLLEDASSLLKDVMLVAFSSLPRSVDITANAKVAGTTVYNGKPAIVSFWDAQIVVPGLMKAALSAYSITDPTTGVNLHGKSNTFVMFGKGQNIQYQLIAEVDNFVFSD